MDAKTWAAVRLLLGHIEPGLWFGPLVNTGQARKKAVGGNSTSGCRHCIIEHFALW